MLPLQITLEGFMSYRDATTLSFEGASLWMLAGQNGAGKSSVFDAMRWTLFNRHRGGAQGQEALIHHQKNKLRVAFDLELATGSFRLIRTLARGGKSTWQIETLDGEKVPETDMRDGYNRWLSENVGLSDETFCAAFYLAQGKGDAILSASPEQRYEMLAEIVDLSAYQRLHEKVKSRSNELESEVRFQRTQFEAAPEAPVGKIAELANRLGALGQQIETGEARRAELTKLEPWAAQWQRLVDERGETERYLESAQQLLLEAPQIERDYARLLELETLLPALNQWLQNQQRVAQTRSEAEAVTVRLTKAQEKSGREDARLQEARQKLAALETERQQQEAIRLEALSKLNSLAPSLNEARNLEKARTELVELEAQHAAYPSDLREQKANLDARIANAQNQKVALGALTRFERARQAWQTATDEERKVAARKVESEAQVAKVATELRASECALESHREALTRALETLTAAVVRRRDAEGAMQRFNEVKGDTNCHFCGQRLTPEHAAREEKRLQIALEEAVREENAAQEVHQKVQADYEAVQSTHQVLLKSLRDAEKGLQKQENEREKAAQAQQTAIVTATEGLAELSEEFGVRFDGQVSPLWDEARVLAALNQEFPTAHDLDALRRGGDSLEGWQKQVKRLARDLESQNLLAAQMQALLRQIEPLEARYDTLQLQQLYAQEDALRAELESSTRQIAGSVPARDRAGNEVREAENALAAIQREIGQYETQLVGLQAGLSEIERALLIQKGGATPAVVSLLEQETSELQAHFKNWTNEKQLLAEQNLPERIKALQQERQRVQELEGSLAQLEKSVQQVPVEARRAPETLRHEIGELGDWLQNWVQERRQIEVEKSNWERIAAEKERLQKALFAIETQARQHKTLADLLGPQQLQRYLLREAENGIVDEANAILDRISTGSLRLELRADDDEIVGARKGPPKILDVAVFQGSGEAASQGMLPAFLSGSQRFRVAVALALGIGRYATRGQGHSRLESVIIDEGFGSLDKIGRGEMIDELKSLGDELKRVILVSHQEEFAEAFSNRYLIENDGVASTARLMVD